MHKIIITFNILSQTFVCTEEKPQATGLINHSRVFASRVQNCFTQTHFCTHALDDKILLLVKIQAADTSQKTFLFLYFQQGNEIFLMSHPVRVRVRYRSIVADATILITVLVYL